MYQQLEKDVTTITEFFPEMDESEMEILPVGALPLTSQWDQNEDPIFCSSCVSSLILSGRNS